MQNNKEEEKKERIEFKYIIDTLEISVLCSVDADMSTLIESFKSFALAVGYSPKTVEEYLDD